MSTYKKLIAWSFSWIKISANKEKKKKDSMYLTQLQREGEMTDWNEIGHSGY